MYAIRWRRLKFLVKMTVGGRTAKTPERRFSRYCAREDSPVLAETSSHLCRISRFALVHSGGTFYNIMNNIFVSPRSTADNRQIKPQLSKDYVGKSPVFAGGGFFAQISP